MTPTMKCYLIYKSNVGFLFCIAAGVLYLLLALEAIINSLAMIFKSMLGRVLQGLSNFSPVKNLIKYILDRSLNELLSDQISLQDFKNGQLLLTNIGLNLEKINRDYLLSSPYILHQGRIRKLRVTLPGWSELSTRSIEVTAEGLQIDLKPNKSFADNFKEAMREQSSQILQQEEPGELNESNPMDFFRQLVRQIILNMKISIENSVIRLFINEPTGEPTAKPQYYLMTRLPLLTIGKSQEAPVKEEDTEEIKFDLIVPQLSVHLLREGASFPEYANEKVSKDEFPFTYPPVHHPSTILLVGQPKIDKERSTKLTITLTTYFKKQRKIVSIQGKITNFEATLDPIQLKILSRFIVQLKQFQRILKSVMTELGLTQPPLGLSRRDSKNKSMSHDLFSSIMMSISEPKQQAPSAQIGLFTSMMQSPQMLRAAAEFNQTATEQLRKSGNFQEGEGWKNINFKQETRVAFSLEQLQANFLKYVTASAFERHWAAENEDVDRVNESLGCSHFRLSVRGLSYTFNSGANLHEVRMRVARLQDARLKNQVSFHNSVSEEFYELDSSTFYNTNVNQDYFTLQPQLINFRRGNDQHYCLEELFRLSEGQEPPKSTPGVRSYAFMPCAAQCGQGAGLTVSFNGDIKGLKVDIKEVAVMVNFQIWKDVLNIIFPVFLYRKLHERINLQSPQLAPAQTQPRNMDLFESQYRFNGMLVEQAEGKQQKLQVRARVGLVYCFYREANDLKTKQNLFEQVQRKILDSDNFAKHCFCELNERGIYAQIHELQWQQVGDEFNLSITEVKAGMLAVADSKIQQDVKPILIVDRLRVEESKVEVRRQGRNDFLMKSRTFVPRARFVVELPVLISFIDMAKRVVSVIDSLQSFKKNLSAKLLIIEQEMTNKPSKLRDKAQKERVAEVLVGEVELKMLLISTYLRGVYFRKRGGEMQIKLDSFAIGLAKKLDIRLGQFKNQLLTQQYPLTQKYPGIKDTHLILQAGRESKARVYGAAASQMKNKRRLQRKLQFFEAVGKENMSVWVIINEKIESGQRKDSKVFKFDKARKNSVIEEEKRISDITVLPLVLNLHAGNLAFLLQHKQEIQDILAQVGKVMTEIKEESKDIIERRDSIESQGEATSQIKLTINDLQLNIDIKPDFQYNPETGLRVLSNSRMYLGVRMQKLSVTTNPDSKQTSFNLTLSLNAHFLHYLDKDIELNLLLLNATDLQGLGFRRILDMNELMIIGSLNGKTGAVGLQCGVDAIKVELCLTTIPLLRLFLDHFLQHSLAGDYGTADSENFIILDNELQEDEPEDLTQKLQEYQQLLQQKRKAYNQYSIREFIVRESEKFKFSLNSFKLGVLKVKLFGGNEFKFLEVNSLNESKATQRGRIEGPDLLNYLALTIENVKVKAEQTERTQALVQLERLELQLSYKRKEGLLWGAEKDYSAHLLKINSPLRILVEMAPDYLKVKLNALEMNASLTDEVFSLADQFSKAATAANNSSWKRQYGVNRVGGDQSRKMLLVILPEGRITASVEFKRTKLLSERVLKLQELVLHEQQANERQIARIFHDWGMQIFTSNLGTLVSGALFEVLSACIGLLFGGMKQLLGLFLPRPRE